MGIYLGQLPPAEIARLKAELAETLIANFCYPRFFDHRTESLQMRPVDRAKRQEVWLYLSSVDFTAWSRIDLMSPDFQHQIERLFIQFVQRNRSFFGNQGRRRMSDIRMLINSCATTVTQGLRNHLAGKKSGTHAFGSPRPVVSWTVTTLSKRNDLSWEQIANSTMLLQQQVLEARGEAKVATAPPKVEAKPPVSQPLTPPPVASAVQVPTAPRRPETPAAKSTPTPPKKPEPVLPKVSEPLRAPVEPQPVLAAATTVPTATAPMPAKTAPSSNGVKAATAPSTSPLAATASSSAPRDVMSVGEDDIAIFEQMRHQLIVWLRIEAVTAGLEITNQGPAQLLEMLRQQARIDETRIQVVSTLLNLSNQVIKTGFVSVLDYKQALMFHLMHTRR